MQKHGIIKDGNLLLSSKKLDGYKPVQYAEIPDFDQSTNYVVQSVPVDNADHIFVDVEIRKLEITEGEAFDEGHI